MKWFRKIVWRVCKRAWEDDAEFTAQQRADEIGQGQRTRRARINVPPKNNFWTDDEGTGHSCIQADSMTFKLYTCVGGHILETHVYDKHDDETKHTLYMIKEEEDFAKQVSQSIMMEMIKQ
jgi:hypothetical protein